MTESLGMDSVIYGVRMVLVVAVMEYVYLVPYVEEPDHIFLKTVIPSRKATRDYGRRGLK
jgi:hypothetical protein